MSQNKPETTDKNPSDTQSSEMQDAITSLATGAAVGAGTSAVVGGMGLAGYGIAKLFWQDDDKKKIEEGKEK